MILLVSPTDKLQLVTSAAGDVDAHASFVDYDGAAVTPGRKNTPIAAQATTDVVDAPGAGVQRNVKTLHVRNKGAGAVDVTVQHTDGANAVELYKATMNAGAQLQYTEGLGFLML